MWSNCLFWAVWQRIRHGGRIRHRGTHDARLPRWFPHFMWEAPDGRVFGYTPKRYYHKDVIILFDGHVIEEPSRDAVTTKPRKVQ